MASQNTSRGKRSKTDTRSDTFYYIKINITTFISIQGLSYCCIFCLSYFDTHFRAAPKYITTHTHTQKYYKNISFCTT